MLNKGVMHKSLNRYKAVFFDAGDTLLTIPDVPLTVRNYLAERSFHREHEQIGTSFKEAIRQFYYEKKHDKYELCTPESDRMFWVELYSYAMGKLGAPEFWDEQEIYNRCHELYDIFTAPDQYELFDDVKECLTEIDNRGLRLGIISNFAPTLPSILEEKGIRPFFNPLIVSTQVGLEKPNPAIFQLSLEMSGLRAEDILYVGDHDLNDHWAPQQVGMDAIIIKRYDHDTGEGIRSLHELL